MSYRPLLNKIQAAKKEIELRVIAGQAQDYEGYRFLIGQIQGLQIAIDIYEDLIQRGLNEETL